MTSKSSHADTVARVRTGFESVRARVKEAASRTGRPADDIAIVAVSKTVDRDVIDAGYEAGIRDFGENRVQDVIAKYEEAVPDDFRLHFIGPMQSNKVRQSVGRFDLIHSVDRSSLVDEFAKRIEGSRVAQPVLIQVNVASEPQKHGCSPDEAPRLLELILQSEGIIPRGFMMMAPFVDDPEEARPHFESMRIIAARIQSAYPEVDLSTLSMGMTNDFEVAIEEGATMVRVGRAIFHAGEASQ